jgi:hypothetical protein
MVRNCNGIGECGQQGEWAKWKLTPAKIVDATELTNYKWLREQSWGSQCPLLHKGTVALTLKVALGYWLWPMSNTLHCTGSSGQGEESHKDAPG